MADNNSANSHGAGEDVIDPAGPFLGWLSIGLLILMAVFSLVVIGAGASHGFQ